MTEQKPKRRKPLPITVSEEQFTRVLETTTFDKISRIFDKKFRTVVWETYKKNCKL